MSNVGTDPSEVEGVSINGFEAGTVLEQRAQVLQLVLQLAN